MKLIMIMILLLTSCNQYKVLSDGVVNSGVPIYKDNENIYYCEYIDETYTICKDLDKKEVLVKLSPHEAISSICANEKYLYYTVVASNNDGKEKVTVVKKT